MKNLTPIALGMTLAISSIAHAEEGFRQHNAHVHGQVEFNIAQDGSDLLFEITAPGADVVGFEHAPQTEQQQQQLNAAMTTLNQAAEVFVLTDSASCHLIDQSVTHTLGGDDHDNHKHDEEHQHHDQEHDDHKHDEEHQHHDHDHDHDDHKHDEEHQHHDHEHNSSSHGEFTVQYHYQCDNIKALNNIETQWFAQFPSTESIKVNLLTDTKQAALELDQNQTMISF